MMIQRIIGYTRDHKGKVIGRHLKDVANTLCSVGVGSTAQYVLEIHTDQNTQNMRYRIRRLTPKECFRLMDVDDSDIQKIQDTDISKTQQYKMAGNSIVVACLDYILESYFFPMEQPKQKGPIQLTLF